LAETCSWRVMFNWQYNCFMMVMSIHDCSLTFWAINDWMARISKGLRVKTAALPIGLNAKKNSRSDLDMVKTINSTYLAEIQPCPAVTMIHTVTLHYGNCIILQWTERLNMKPVTFKLTLIKNEELLFAPQVSYGHANVGFRLTSVCPNIEKLNHNKGPRLGHLLRGY